MINSFHYELTITNYELTIMNDFFWLRLIIHVTQNSYKINLHCINNSNKLFSKLNI